MAVHIKIPQPWDISGHRLAPEALYWNRRQVLRALGLTGTGMAGYWRAVKAIRRSSSSSSSRPGIAEALGPT